VSAACDADGTTSEFELPEEAELDLIAAGCEVESLSAPPRRPWARQFVHVPPEVVAEIERLVRADWVRVRVLERADEKVCRRLRADSMEARAKRWRTRWRLEERDRTRDLIRRAVTAELRQVHIEQTCSHGTYAAVPEGLVGLEVGADGALWIDDLPNGAKSIGARAFFEQTPPGLLQWVYERWTASTANASPAVWDLTAGSGTSVDLLRHIHGCALVATDLTVTTETGIGFGDCRAIGRLPGHRGAVPGALSQPEIVVREPDVILFDPPSRGAPTHADLYDGPPTGDLARLPRDDYVTTVAAVLILAARRLAEGGVVSFLLRCGARGRRDLIRDAALLGDVVDAIGCNARIVHQMSVEFGARANQTSLGQARLPAAHLLIERAP
jgi:hypothetical protein